ncbi:hypothetical protein [Streptosporangium sp. CA-115845]|uniref:hypothetical protein n=1 Tax=Streptosporangium sp. CA-115845 TaxID=3240071 RepID=UPI003D8F298F
MTLVNLDATPVADLLAALTAHPRLSSADLQARAELCERIRNHPTEPAVEYGVRRTWWTGRWAQDPASRIETSASNPFDRQWAETEVAAYRKQQAEAGLPVDAELVTRQWVPIPSGTAADGVSFQAVLSPHDGFRVHRAGCCGLTGPAQQAELFDVAATTPQKVAAELHQGIAGEHPTSDDARPVSFLPCCGLR